MTCFAADGEPAAIRADGNAFTSFGLGMLVELLPPAAASLDEELLDDGDELLDGDDELLDDDSERLGDGWAMTKSPRTKTHRRQQYLRLRWVGEKQRKFPHSNGTRTILPTPSRVSPAFSQAPRLEQRLGPPDHRFGLGA